MKHDSRCEGSKDRNCNRRKKGTLVLALTAIWIVLVLSGCAGGKDNGDGRSAAEDGAEGESAGDAAGGGQSIHSLDDIDVDAQDLTEADNPETATDAADGNTSAVADTQPESTEKQGTSANTGSLYEQFLKNEIAATVTMNDPTAEYRVPPLEEGSTYTFEQLGQKIAAYFLDPEYRDKTSYDQVQYAYVNSPDSTGAEKLLVKFIGLDIYSPDDDSYAVVVVSEENGQLSITAEYECWARSATTIYNNGMLFDYGSGGAGDHYGGTSILSSDGKITSVYGSEELYGEWARSVSEVYGESDAIYQEVFGTDTYPGEMIVVIYTVDDERYYQYDLSGCTEEQKVLCELYINRCHDELGIEWVSQEDVQAAIEARCSELGIRSELLSQQPELAWNIAD